MELVEYAFLLQNPYSVFLLLQFSSIWCFPYVYKDKHIYFSKPMGLQPSGTLLCLPLFPQKKKKKKNPKKYVNSGKSLKFKPLPGNLLGWPYSHPFSFFDV